MHLSSEAIVNSGILDLQERLQILKVNIFAQEELVADKMKSYFGNKPKYIIFISFSDGVSRAYVFKGIGNSLDTSWKNAIDLMSKKLKELESNPLWIKADIVKDIKEYSYDDFIGHISKIRKSFFREGISFDKMFNTAFMEQEVNANAFIDREKGSEIRHLVWNNISYYMKSIRGLNYKINENSVERIYTFTTIGFFHDSHKLYNLTNEWLNNGQRYLGKVDESLIRFLLDKASKYLVSQIDITGKFHYGYFSCYDREIPEYNNLRHASTTYSMLEAYELSPDASLGQAIKSALNYLVSEGIELIKNVNGVTMAFVVERCYDNEIKLGGNAAAILALSKYTIVFNDLKYVPLMQQLAEGIDHFHNKHDGSFVHVLNFPDLSIKEEHRIIFYDGEAAFALMRLYDIDKNERWLNIVEQAFEYFIENKYWLNNDHWLSYASNELFKYRIDRRYVEFNFKNASGVLDYCLATERTFPTLLELLMATYNMIEKLKRENLFIESLEFFDYEKFTKAINFRVENQANGMFYPEMAMYFKAPQKILWAFYYRHHTFRVRIDDIEHNISGYCSYLRQVLLPNNIGSVETKFN